MNTSEFQDIQPGDHVVLEDSTGRRRAYLVGDVIPFRDGTLRCQVLSDSALTVLIGWITVHPDGLAIEEHGGRRIFSYNCRHRVVNVIAGLAKIQIAGCPIQTTEGMQATTSLSYPLAVSVSWP